MTDHTISLGLDSKGVEDGERKIKKSAAEITKVLAGMDDAFSKFSEGLAKKSRPGLEALKASLGSTVADIHRQLQGLESEVTKLAKAQAKAVGDAAKATKDLEGSAKGAAAAVAGIGAAFRTGDGQTASMIKSVKAAAGAYDSLTMSVKTAMGASLGAGAGMTGTGRESVRALAGAYDSLSMSIKAAVSQDRLLGAGAGAAGTGKESVRALAGAYDSLSMSVKAAVTQDRLLGAGAGMTGTGKEAVRALAGAYDSLTMSIKAAVSQDRLLGAGAGAAGTGKEAVRALAGAYDSLTMSIKAATTAQSRALGAGAGMAGAGKSPAAPTVGVYDPISMSYRSMTKAAEEAHAPLQRLTSAQAHLNAVLRDGHSAARGLASGFGAMWLTWGNIAPLLAGAAISHSFVQMAKEGAHVQHTLTQVRVLAGESAASVASLNAQMLELARSGPFGPREIADALKVLTLAGLSARDAGQAVHEVLNFSLAGDIGVKQAADVLTSLGTAFKISANNYGYVSDVISKAAAESKSSVEDFGGAMKTASVINLQYGVSLEETAVGIALLANAGIRGTAAGTAMRNVYVDLSGRTKDVQKALDALGVQAIDPLTGKMRATKDVFNDLLSALSKKTPTEASDFIKRIFSERGGKEAQAIMDGLMSKAKEMGSTAASAYEELAQKVAQASGFAAIAAAERSLTPLKQMESVKATLQASFVETFDSLQPYILQLSNDLKGIFNSENFRAGLQGLAVGVGELIRLAVEWGKEIASLFLVYKSLSGVLGILAAVAAGMRAISAATAAAAASATALSLGMKAVALANPIMLALTGIVTAGAAAWGWYQVNKDRALEKTVVGSNLESLNKALEDELRHLNNVNQARREGISLAELEATQKAKLAGVGAKSEVDALSAARDEKLQALKTLEAKSGKGSGAIGDLDTRWYKSALEEFRTADAAFLAAAAKNRALQSRNEELIRQIKAASEEGAAVARSTRPHVIGDPRATPTSEPDAKTLRDANREMKSRIGLMLELDGYNRSFLDNMSDLIDMYAIGDISLGRYVEQVSDLAKKQPIAIQLTKEAEKAVKDRVANTARNINSELKAYYDEVKAIEEVDKVLNDLAHSNAAQVEYLELEQRLMGQSAKYREEGLELLRLEQKYKSDIAKISAMGLEDEVAKSKISNLQILYREEVSNVLRQREITKWNSTFDTISDGLLDALEEGGSAGAKSVREMLWNEIVGKPFRMVVQALIQPIAGALTGAATGGSGGASGTLSTVSGLAGLGDKAVSLANNFNGAGLVDFAKSGMGQSLGLSQYANVPGIAESSPTLTGAGSALSGLPIGGILTAYNVGGAEGFVSGVASTAIAGAVSTLGTATSAMAGAYAALAAIPVWGWIAMGAAALLGMEHGGPKAESGYGYGISTGSTGARVVGDSTGPAALYNAGIEDTWSNLASSFGIGSSLKVGSYTAQDPQGDSPTQVQVVAGLDGRTVYNRSDRLRGDIENVGRTPEELQTALTNEATFVIFNALRSSDIDKQYREYLQTVADGLPALKSEAEQVQAMNTALSDVAIVRDFTEALNGLPFESLKNLGFDAGKGLIQASGGLSNLSANLSGFYDNFYSDSEKLAQQTKVLTTAFADQGIVMPQVDANLRTWYRTLVDAMGAIDLSSAANAQAYNSVLSLQGAMSQLAPAFEDVEASVRELIAGVSEKADATLWGMQYGMQDNAGKYNMLDVRTDGINAQMLGSSDITTIAALAEQQIDLLNDAWSLLDSTQQKDTYLDFESRINEVEDYVIAKGADTISLKKAENEAMAATIAAAVEAAVAKAMESSAAAMQAAADKAQQPLEVTSNITVSVSAPQGSEVSVEENRQ